MPTYQGSCHCALVTFEVDAEPTRLSQCNCSMCFAKGAVYVPVREIEDLRILSGRDDLIAYQFGTRTATHYFCRRCGIHPFHRPRMDPSRWSVNARCLADFPFDALPRTSFDGRNWEEAARREGFAR